MATPNKESIETFMSITGVSEAIAVRKLEEHHGNLNQAVNAFFSEEDRSIHQTGPAPPDDVMDIDDPISTESQRPYFPLLSSRNLNPFSLLDSNISIFDSGTNFPTQTPIISHPRDVREIPIEVKDVSEQSGRSGLGPTIEDVTETADIHGPESHGTVIIDEEDDNELSTSHVAGHSSSWGTDSRPSAPQIDAIPEYSNDIEEEMVRAAIEASKRDSGLNSPSHHLPTAQPHAEDTDFVQAVSLSLKTAEQEKKLRDGEASGSLELEAYKSSDTENPDKLASSNGRLGVGSSYTPEGVEDVEEEPLIRHRRRQMSSGSLDAAKETRETETTSPPSLRLNNTNPPPNNGTFQSDEWGGISSEEHDEAVMLEAALFGGIPEGSGYQFPYASHHFMPNGLDRNGGSSFRQITRPLSPSLAAQRLIREQQDDEYFASLQADREKEMKAKEVAEARRLEEIAAKEAALEEEKRKEEESRRKLEEEQEIERELAAKEASLPQEPTADEESAITLVVRMPDGSRRGRRFLKSDKLQHLFDFIDIGRGVKTGTYRLVRPYPRRAFGDGERALTLDELGLTSKQEALFLELI